MLMRQWTLFVGLLGLSLLGVPDSLHAFRTTCGAYEDPEERAECEDLSEQDAEDDAAAEEDRRALAEALAAAEEEEEEEEEEMPSYMKPPDGPMVPLNGSALDRQACENKVVTKIVRTMVTDCWLETLAMAAACGSTAKGTGQPWTTMACTAAAGFVRRCVVREIEEEVEEVVEVCDE